MKFELDVGMSPIQAATRALDVLESYLTPGGWPTCYPDFQSFLYDFYPNLPWNPADCVIAINALFSDTRFPTMVTTIQKQFNFDFIAELRTALKLNSQPEPVN